MAVLFDDILFVSEEISTQIEFPKYVPQHPQIRLFLYFKKIFYSLNWVIDHDFYESASRLPSRSFRFLFRYHFLLPPCSVSLQRNIAIVCKWSWQIRCLQKQIPISCCLRSGHVTSVTLMHTFHTGRINIRTVVVNVGLICLLWHFKEYVKMCSVHFSQ